MSSTKYGYAKGSDSAAIGRRCACRLSGISHRADITRAAPAAMCKGSSAVHRILVEHTQSFTNRAAKQQSLIYVLCIHTSLCDQEAAVVIHVPTNNEVCFESSSSFTLIVPCVPFLLSATIQGQQQKGQLSTQQVSSSGTTASRREQDGAVRQHFPGDGQGQDR